MILKRSAESGVVIDVHSCELNPPCHFSGKLIENRRDRPAGRPHIQQDGERRALDLRGKARVCAVDGMADFGNSKRGFAAAANRLASRACGGNTKFTMNAELSANAGATTGSIILFNQPR